MVGEQGGEQTRIDSRLLVGFEQGAVESRFFSSQPPSVNREVILAYSPPESVRAVWQRCSD